MIKYIETNNDGLLLYYVCIASRLSISNAIQYNSVTSEDEVFKMFVGLNNKNIEFGLIETYFIEY